MEWLSDILGSVGTVAATVGSGGALGLIGSVAGAVSKSRQRKAEMTEKQAEREHELKLLDMQMNRKSQEDAHEAEVIGIGGSFEGLAASLQAEAVVSDVHKWVNDIRALTRPTLTILLIIIVGWFFENLLTAIQTGGESALVTILGRAAVIDLLTYIVYSMVFSATTAIVWWFGDRALTPPAYRGR